MTTFFIVTFLISIGLNILLIKRNRSRKSTIRMERAKRMTAESSLSKLKSDSNYYKKQFEQIKYGK